MIVSRDLLQADLWCWARATLGPRLFYKLGDAANTVDVNTSDLADFVLADTR